MNNLEKRLTKNAKSSISESEEVVKSAKLLLEKNASEEISTLKSIGLDVDLKIVESNKEDILTRKIANERFNREIVHRKEIEKFCLDYRLYMKQANQYAGRIPAELGAELTRFCKEKNIVLTADSSYSKFYIIAPPKMFVGYRSPLKVAMDAAKISISAAKERKRLRDLDPILVYELENNPQYYAVVKSWGNDFTWLRRIYGFFTRKVILKPVIFLGYLAMIFSLFKIGTMQYSFFEILSDKYNGTDFWMFLSIVIDIALLALGLYLIFDKTIRDFWKEIIKIVTRENE